MDENISKYLGKYRTLYGIYRSLMREVRLGIIDFDILLKKIDPSEVETLRELCINDYAVALSSLSNKESVYYEWLRSVSSKADFYLLEVLLLVQTKVGNIDYSQADLFLLNYFVEYFEKSDNEDSISYAKYLFEWVLDTLDDDTRESSQALEKIFSLGKETQWFVDFYDQIRKLTLKAPVDERTFRAVKKGLLGTTTPEIKEFLQEYLEDRIG